MMIETRFATGQVELNYAASSVPGPPIVLLHGLCRRWQDWRTVLGYLVPSWQVFALDLRGHGRSGRTPGAYRIADYVPDVLHFLQERVNQPAVLIGHSVGGNIAAAVAARAPELVRAIVLEDPPLGMAGPRLAETVFFETFRVFRRYAGSPSPIAMIAAALADEQIVVPGHPGAVRLGALRGPAALRFTASCLADLDPEALDVPISGRWLDGGDVRADSSRVRCPTLILQADFEAGGILPPDHLEQMLELLADRVVVRFSDTGHIIHATAPEAMLCAVLAFLGAYD